MNKERWQKEQEVKQQEWMNEGTKKLRQKKKSKQILKTFKGVGWNESFLILIICPGWGQTFFTKILFICAL